MNPTTRQVDSRDPPEITPEQHQAMMLNRVKGLDFNSRPYRHKEEVSVGSKHHRRPVRDVETGETWPSLRHCAKAIGMSDTGICNLLKTGRRTRSGRLLEYVDAA